MSASTKRVAAAGGALLLLLAVVLPIIAIVLRDPIVNSDPVRDEIAALLFEYTGRRVDLVGDIDIDEFPWITVIVGPGELENPADFSGPPLLAWDEIRLRLHYSSVYADAPLLEPVIVAGLKVNLQRNAAGRDNWSDLGPLVDTGPPTAPLALPGIELRGLELRYLDESVSPQALAAVSGGTLQIKDIRRGVGAVEGARWQIGALELDGTIEAQLPGKAAKDGALNGRMTTRVTKLEAYVPENEPPEVSIDRATFEFGVLRADLAQLQWQPPILATRLELRAAALDALLKTVGVTAPFESRSQLWQLRRLQASLRLDNETLRIDDLDAQIDATRVRGALTLGEPIELALEIDSLDVDRYAAALGGGGPRPSGGADTNAPLIFPGQMLRGLPLAGSVRVGEIRASGAVLAGVTLRLD